MRDKTSGSEAVWQEEEISSAALPDKRLARRLRRLLDQMSAAPGKPVPAACGDWVATKCVPVQQIDPTSRCEFKHLSRRSALRPAAE